MGIGLALLWRNRTLSFSLIICVALTAVWGGVVSIGAITEYPHVKLIQSAEAARDGAWMFLVYAIYGVRLRGSKHFLAQRRWLPWYTAGMILVLVHLYTLPWLLQWLGLPPSLESDFNFIMWLGFSVAILVMVEQIYRLSNASERWAIKYLCLGLGFLAGYDFLMYTEALILRHLNPRLWEARGAVAACTAPLIAIALIRSHKHNSEAQVSRHVVFHTFTLLASGFYLLYMAGVGYAINYFGGTWAGALQITFLSISALMFIVLMISSRVRNLVRVWLSKHFFSYRYDYRREWLDFTQKLAESANAAPRAVTRAMAQLCGSPAGLLWVRTEGGGFALIDHWQMPNPDLRCDLKPLAEWMQQRNWIIDFEEWREAPEIYNGLELPEELVAIPGAWLVVPLIFTERLQGFLLLCRPEVTPDVNWEERDLLKVAGRAAATHLALYQADNALLELRQFEAFNRLSAYVVHDLKNILAQQSLIVFNAEHCRDEPEFLDDVIETVGNSVQRMQRLMTQMRSGVRGARREPVDLQSLLADVIKNKSEQLPKPQFRQHSDSEEDPVVEADPEQLTAVFGHLIQNAQDATPDDGRIRVQLHVRTNTLEITIEDSGCGMDESFVKQRLFKPFDTTKGLTGMGIGAYESREYVRQLGGDIFVSSTPGTGSCFTIILPRLIQAAPETIRNGVVAGG